MQVMITVTGIEGDGSGIQSLALARIAQCENVGTLTGQAYFSTGGGDDQDTLVSTYGRIVCINP
jgi:hypothetical protein